MGESMENKFLEESNLSEEDLMGKKKKEHQLFDRMNRAKGSQNFKKMNQKPPSTRHKQAHRRPQQ